MDYKFEVYAGFEDKELNDVLRKVDHDQIINVCEGLLVKVLQSPCHTKDHILFYMEHLGRHEKIIFTGDTLFIGGCGKFFEGTATDMYKNF